MRSLHDDIAISSGMESWKFADLFAFASNVFHLDDLIRIESILDPIEEAVGHASVELEYDIAVRCA